MKNFFSLVAVALSASAKAIEVFTSEIAKDGKALGLLVETVKDVIPALEASGAKQAAKQLTDAGTVLEKTLTRMCQDVALEFRSELPKSDDFFAIDDRSDGAGPGAIAWTSKAEYAASRRMTVEELEEELAQDVRYLQEDVKYAEHDLSTMSAGDPAREKLEKKLEKARRELARRFGIVA